jgi:hypothetical protein
MLHSFCTAYHAVNYYVFMMQSAFSLWRSHLHQLPSLPWRLKNCGSQDPLSGVNHLGTKVIGLNSQQ